MPGTWMRGEERKNESTKGREENRGLVAAQTRSIRPLPPTSPPPPLSRRARCRTERGTWFLCECIHRYTAGSSFLFSDLTCLSFCLALFRFLPFSYSSPDIFSPLTLSTIRHFEREHPPSMGRFPHDDFGTYLLSFLR